MTLRFNFSNLSPLFNEAIERDEYTIAFEARNGKGSFLFLMFFDDEDEQTKDNLFIYLRNTKKMLEFKMYGNHRRGQCDIYVKPSDEEDFKKELGINPHSFGHPFELESFLSNLNSSFPASLKLPEKISSLRENWSDIKSKVPKRVIDEDQKTVLIGERRLTVGKPRERTLRKLYIHTNAEPRVITNLIECLKKANMTTAWTTKESGIKPKDIRQMINDVQ